MEGKGRDKGGLHEDLGVQIFGKMWEMSCVKKSIEVNQERLSCSLISLKYSFVECSNWLILSECMLFR